MRTIRSVSCLVFSAFLAAVCAASGQAPQTANPSTSSTEPPATVLHARSNLVLVDVVVTDHGKPVHGLSKDRFRVYEDGHEQTIAAFDEHQPPAVPPNAAKVAALIAALPPHTYTNISPYPDTGTVNVLLLDALNTTMDDQQEVHQQMIQYLANIRPGTPLAIFTLASHLQLITGFTTDAAALAKAVKTKGASSQSVVLEDQASSVQSDMESELGTIETDSPSPPVNTVAELEQFESDLTAEQTDMQVKMTIDAFDELANYLSGIPGRKNVIWFSGSFPITIDPDPTVTDSFRNVEAYGEDIKKASALLTAARVAVYPVDARGLMTDYTSDVRYVPSSNGMTVTRKGKLVVTQQSNNIAKDSTKFETQILEEHASMDTIAEQTGGRAFYNNNDLKQAANDAIDSGSNYYTIAYIPGAQKLDGGFRKIKVGLKDAGYKLAYRDGYYSDTGYGPSSGAQSTQSASPIAAAILNGAPPSTQLHLTARVLPATDPLLKGARLPNGPAGQMADRIKGTRHCYVVDMDIDPRGFLFADAPDGGHRAKMEFVLIAYDADGNRLNFQDQAMDVVLKPQQFDNALKNGLHARMFIDMPAGRESLRIAVQDLNAGHAGSLEVPLMVAK